MEFFYRIDSILMEKIGGVAPALHVGFWCKRDKQMFWTVGVLDVDKEVFHEVVRGLVRYWFEKEDISCPKCGDKLIPLCYILSAEGWSAGKDWDGITPPSQCPNRKEVYFSVAVTVFGNNKLLVKEKGGQLRWVDNVEGRIVLPLPSLDEILKKRDNVMFG
jgi:hypothetical protein